MLRNDLQVASLVILHLISEAILSSTKNILICIVSFTYLADIKHNQL